MNEYYKSCQSSDSRISYILPYTSPWCSSKLLMLKTVISFMNNWIWHWMGDGEIACSVRYKGSGSCWSKMLYMLSKKNPGSSVVHPVGKNRMDGSWSPSKCIWPVLLSDTRSSICRESFKEWYLSCTTSQGGCVHLSSVLRSTLSAKGWKGKLHLHHQTKEPEGNAAWALWQSLPHIVRRGIWSTLELCLSAANCSLENT